MATNELLQFATANTNILTQAEYAADAQRTSGNVPGVARSKLVNKAARQAAFVTAMIGQFIADKGGIDVLDDADVPGLVADFVLALNSSVLSFGQGQTWVDVTSSRTPGVTYTNSTNKPIMVSATVSGTVPNSTVSIALLVGSVPVGVGINALVTNANPTQWSIFCEGVVPPGQSYKLSVVQGSLTAWTELR